MTYLGISASVQGRHLEAARFYEEAAGVDVPDRTQTLKNPLAAAGALRRGDQSGAFHMLRSYIADVLDTDNVYVGKFACIEFVKMMVKVDRLPEAARILGFLEATDSLDLAGLQSRVTGATAADPAIVRERATGRNLDDRGALTFMRDVLDRLLDDTSDARD